MVSHRQQSTSSHHLVIDAAPQALSLSRLMHHHRLHLFYGDLHNHTGYSDGTGQPEDALRQMRERGLHFAAITDHGEYFDREPALHSAHQWAAVAEQTAACSSADFVAIRGFEWSSRRQGHSNVWWSAEYTGYLRTGDESMRTYYQWLAAAKPVTGVQEALAGFNHPGREPRCFGSYRYAPELDHRIVTVE